MLEKKNIDRVFQENFKDLEIVPSKRVWNGIAHDLTNTSDRRALPLWRRYGAAAAVFLVFGAASFFYFNNSAEPVIDRQQVNQIPSVEADQQQPRTPTDPSVINAEVVLAQNEEKSQGVRKASEPIFVKKPNNQVIVTTNSISDVYTNIEDRYVVDKDDFIEELRASESITEKMASIPKKTESESEVADRKWSVGPTVAPVYFNTLQSGSPLNRELSDNSKSSDNSLSIGVKVNYQLSPKLFIQSGLNRVDLAYNTNDVNAFITSSKNGYNNINTSKPGVYLTPGQNAVSNPKDLNRSGVSGDINQSMQYYELPLEMKYSLYDKKLGLNLVGGFSTMILSDNSVSFISDDGVTNLGGANNLNNFNFSGNVGVDLDYKINNSWYLNVAPMFKYQFNTYSGDAGDFRPYFFGLYSGLNYKF